jgi:predicted transcriptional regulator
MAKNEERAQRIAEALFECNTMTEAAEKAGVTRRTIYNYLHHDTNFARAYRMARWAAATQFCEDMARRREKACQIIESLMDDTKQSPSVRLRCAVELMNQAAKQEEIVTQIVDTDCFRTPLYGMIIPEESEEYLPEDYEEEIESEE